MIKRFVKTNYKQIYKAHNNDLQQPHSNDPIALIIFIALRYYATFKVRKFKLLFYKINTRLQKNYHLDWIAGRANILSKYIIISKSSSFLL